MRIEDHDEEPVAVVRTLADFAMALTLIVLMLVGTNKTPAESPTTPSSAARAVSNQNGSKKADLILRLVDDGGFLVQGAAPRAGPRKAADLAREWIKLNDSAQAVVVVQFQADSRASELYRAMLELQSAFGTNLSSIHTTPTATP